MLVRDSLSKGEQIGQAEHCGQLRAWVQEYSYLDDSVLLHIPAQAATFGSPTLVENRGSGKHALGVDAGLNIYLPTCCLPGHRHDAVQVRTTWATR